MSGEGWIHPLPPPSNGSLLSDPILFPRSSLTPPPLRAQRRIPRRPARVRSSTARRSSSSPPAAAWSLREAAPEATVRVAPEHALRALVDAVPAPGRRLPESGRGPLNPVRQARLQAAAPRTLSRRSRGVRREVPGIDPARDAAPGIPCSVVGALLEGERGRQLDEGSTKFRGVSGILSCRIAPGCPADFTDSMTENYAPRRDSIKVDPTEICASLHTMFHSSEPEALRAFLRDKLGFSSLTDVGEARDDSSSTCRRRTWGCTRPRRLAGMGCRTGPTTSPSTATISGPRSRSSKAGGRVRR